MTVMPAFVPPSDVESIARTWAAVLGIDDYELPYVISELEIIEALLLSRENRLPEIEQRARSEVWGEACELWGVQ